MKFKLQKENFKAIALMLVLIVLVGVIFWQGVNRSKASEIIAPGNAVAAGIPAGAGFGENDDVVLKGVSGQPAINNIFYADKIKVWQETKDGHTKNEMCNDGTDDANKNDPNCDSKRHFKSLTIDNAVLSHQGLTVDACVGGFAVGQEGCGPDSGSTHEESTRFRYHIQPGDLRDLDSRSLAGESTGTGRWKKVDLVIENDVTMKNNGKIDVSGKGYPGGYFQYTSMSGWIEVSGEGYPDGYIRLSSPDGDSCPGVGYGPGGGSCAFYHDAEDHSIFSASGGHAGQGARGFIDYQPAPGWIPGGAAYDLDSNNPQFEFGSGGGQSDAINDGSMVNDSEAHAVGGAGGGRVRIHINSATGQIIMNGGLSSIAAAGGNGEYEHQINGSVESAAWSGAGAGGTILIEADTAGAGSYSNEVHAGILDHHPWFDGYPESVQFYTATPGYRSADTNNFGGTLLAQGGDGKWGGGLEGHGTPPCSRGMGGGGGVIMIKGAGTVIPPTPTPTKEIHTRKITAEVSWTELKDIKTLKLSTVLSNVIETLVTP